MSTHLHTHKRTPSMQIQNTRKSNNVWIIGGVTGLPWHIRLADSFTDWLLWPSGAECLWSEHFLPPFVAWLGLIKAFCWNKVIIHLAISQFPHNYPPASRALTHVGTRAPTHTYASTATNTFPLWFVSLLRGEWLKGFRVGLLVTA